jgi:hypothetical protein
MDAILAFVLGMLSVVAIGIIVVAIVGYFKARKTEKNLEVYIKDQDNMDRNNNKYFEDEIRRIDVEINQRITDVSEEIYLRISEVERESHSELDSRMNKFENKIYKNNKPEFSDVLTKERLEASKRIMDKID